jgi:hypothetical protein
MHGAYNVKYEPLYLCTKFGTTIHGMHICTPYKKHFLWVNKDQVCDCPRFDVVHNGYKVDEI